MPFATLLASAKRQWFEAYGGLDIPPTEHEDADEDSGPQRPPTRTVAQGLGRPGAPALDVVARVYSVAMARGDAPTKAVMAHFDLPRATASRWIRSARDLGVLPKTSRGRMRGAAVVPTESTPAPEQ